MAFVVLEVIFNFQTKAPLWITCPQADSGQETKVQVFSPSGLVYFILCILHAVSLFSGSKLPY